MKTLPNVSLAREASSAAVYLVVGDTKFWIVDESEFNALGFRWQRVRVVADGSLGHLTERRLHAAPVTRPSDVFFDCGQDLETISGKWHFNCQSSGSLVRRDVLVAGWLHRSSAETPEMPYVNQLDHGIEDIHFDVLLDAVFLDRVYGPNGLSSRLDNAQYRGNPTDAVPLPFATGPPVLGTVPGTITYNSWILPGTGPAIHGELNAWHVNNTGGVFTRHFVGRGSPPAHWVHPFPSDDGAYFPFHPLNPDGRERNLRTGDYVIMRGPLWQDHWHGDPSQVQDPWDTDVTRHHGWLEMHPIDWIVRVLEPGPNARLTASSAAPCTPAISGPPVTHSVSITPGFRPSRASERLEVRTVERIDDLRMGMIVPSSVRAVTTNRQVEQVDVEVTVVPVGTRQGRFKGCWLVGWSEIDQRDRQWVDDTLPAGAQQHADGEAWTWVSEPAPFHRTVAHQSGLVAGVHQHYFDAATETMEVGVGDLLFTGVFLDPDAPPDEVMLQWHTTGWLHRAYWGADLIPWGAPGTSERAPMGRLPFAGEWVRLEVPAATVGLEGRTVTGMAFTLSGGRATWDYSGVRAAVPKSFRLAVTVSPGSVRPGLRTVTVRARDTGDQSPVAGRVLLEGQDVAATNTPFQRRYPDDGEVTFTVVCPGYPQATARLRVLPPVEPVSP